MESLEVIAAYFRCAPSFSFSLQTVSSVAVRQQNLSRLHGKRLCVHRGIVDRDRDVEVAEVAAAKTLLDVQRFAVRMPRHVETRAIGKPRRVDDKRVAFPPADGISTPGRVEILRKAAAIHVDLPEVVVQFVQQRDDRRRLNDLERRVAHEIGLR